MSRLRRGDLPPRIVHPPPGPKSRRLAKQLTRWEAPGINTVGPDGSTLAWEEALGSNVLDVDGNRFVDFTSGFGVAAIGHRHPDVVKAVCDQSRQLLHGLGDVHAHRLRAQLARELCGLAPVAQSQAYFAVSGSDAVEIALKTSLLATGRQRVLAFDPAYHGLSLGALQATSRAAFRQPFAAHLHSQLERLPFGCSVTLIDEWFRRHSDTACVIVEPIIGREGVLIPPPGWLAHLNRRCRESGTLLIVDEVLTGFGRTGKWFAVESEAVEPDLVCCGKALGGGLPIAAVIGSRELLAHWQSDGEALHTGTFVAHPLACAAALAVLKIMRSQRLPQRASRLARIVSTTLSPLQDRSRSVVEVRGRGLLWGLELTDAASAHRLADELLQRGLLILAGGPAGRVLQLAPPLTITESQLTAGLELIVSLATEI